MNLGQMKRPWKADTGPDRYRRGLYTFFWRATPFPFLTTFDAPGGMQTCTRRLRSNTPLQALTLLNDPALVEIAARPGRADRQRDGPHRRSDRDRIDRAFVLCLGRAPTRTELARARATARSGAGRAGPRHGRRSRPAAWTAVARVLLNLDEFVTRE